MSDEWLKQCAIGATAATIAVLAAQEQDDSDVVVIIFADRENSDAFAFAGLKFLRAAPTATAADVLRFGAAKGLHLIPADAYEETSSDVRLFFDAFTGAAKGLIAQFAPVKRPHSIAPVDFPAPAHDDLYEREGADPAVREESTGAMRVIAAPAAPAEHKRGTPTLAEFQMMSPEERRAFSGAFGFPALLDQVAAGERLIDSKAPAPARVIGPAEFEREPGESGQSAVGNRQAAPAAPAKGKKRR